MLQVAICDDERYIQGNLETMLIELGKIKNFLIDIEVFMDGKELVQKITDGQRFDIIFMDIEMKFVDGIKASEQIRKLDKGVQIIFVTSHDHYIRDVFKVAPIGFLSKPIKPEEVEHLFLYTLNYVKNQDAYYRFKYYKSYYQIPVREIIYFHSCLRDLEIVCKIEKYQQCAKLTDAEKQLALCDCEFIRIHRSYLVNRRYIRQYAYEKIFLQNGEILPIGKTYIKQMQTILNDERMVIRR